MRGSFAKRRAYHLAFLKTSSPCDTPPKHKKVDDDHAKVTLEPVMQALYPYGKFPVGGCIVSVIGQIATVVSCNMETEIERDSSTVFAYAEGYETGKVVLLQINLVEGGVVAKQLCPGYTFVKPSAVTVSKNGEFLAVRDNYGVHFVDFRDEQVQFPTKSYLVGNIYGMAKHGDQGFFTIDDKLKYVVYFDGKEGEIIERKPLPKSLCEQSSVLFCGANEKNGDVALVDWGEHSVHILNKDLERKAILGSPGFQGKAPGMLSNPIGALFLPDNRVLVVDATNERVQAFQSNTGKVSGFVKFPVTGDMVELKQITCLDAVVTENYVYIAAFHMGLIPGVTFYAVAL